MNIGLWPMSASGGASVLTFADFLARLGAVKLPVVRLRLCWVLRCLSGCFIGVLVIRKEGRRKKEEGRRNREEGRRKKEEGRRKKEEGRRKREEGRRKKEEGCISVWQIHQIES